MTQARITIDGTVVMDENLGNWQARPPEFLKKMVDTKGPHEPHIKALGVTLADSLLMGRDVAIDVTTNNGDGTWSMSVKQTLAVSLPAADSPPV